MISSARNAFGGSSSLSRMSHLQVPECFGRLKLQR
jgi:hypothetical protein